jgi:hypothetical protein
VFLVRGALCRSMSHYFNVPNINVLHINRSIHQPDLVDVWSTVVTLNALKINCSTHQLSTEVCIDYTERRKTERIKNIKCPKSKFIKICLKESFHREVND